MSTMAPPNETEQGALALDFRAAIAARAADGPDAAELRPGSSREEIVAKTLFGAEAHRVSFTGLPEARELLFDGQPTRLKIAPRGLAVGPYVVARIDGTAGTLRSEDWKIFTPKRLAQCVSEDLERLERIIPKPELGDLAAPAQSAPAEAEPELPLAQSMGLRVVDWGIDE